MDTVKNFFDWLFTNVQSLKRKVEILRGNDTITPADKLFLDGLTKDLQDLNNKLPQFRKIIEKATVNGTGYEKELLAEKLKNVAEPFRQCG